MAREKRVANSEQENGQREKEKGKIEKRAGEARW
jgi:hypothetical protein